jgi:glycosyltransferase involved in cell wall biosynthesis
MSQVRLLDRESWGNVRDAIVKGGYERAYAPLLDRAWVVSERERRAMAWVAGVRRVDVLPNGIDGDYYRPISCPELDRSLVFWGRLDFGPNIQAIDWFLARVWPQVRERAPDARFTIIGFRPTDAIRRLDGRSGIAVLTDLDDLRAEVSAHAVVVFPFVSGGGIKNKLLEAASLGKAIVCSPRACSGLCGSEPLPLVKVETPERWVQEIFALWSDPGRRRALGVQARAWVVEEHSWAAAARDALSGLVESAGMKTT